MLSFLLCRQVKDKSKKLWKAWWTPRTDLPLRKAACKLVSHLFIYWNQFFMPLQAKGFYSDNICSLHWFAALFMWSCLSSGSLSTPRSCKNLLSGIFQNETRNKTLNVSYTIFLTKVFFLFKSKVEHLQEEVKSFGAIKVLQRSFQFSFVECELNLEACCIIDVWPNCSAPWNSIF